ncbi:cell division cycle protein 16 homolog [Haliotis cracherodii]|uniref:cell division cycle protein 16 homolog n=1 Tax=Haliotis cracherodii TaxID=6455 RepID=UPI0039E7B933
MAGEIEGSAPPASVETKINLVRLRERVRSYIDKHHYDSALFWADKLVSLSGGSVEDVYWYAQTLYLTGQYHRASHLLRNKKLDKTHPSCRYLAAKCHYECREWQEALNILDMVDNTHSLNTAPPRFNLTDAETSLLIKDSENSVNLLRGKIYEAMDNRQQAAVCFQEALKQDVYCYEAFDLLVNHHMLTAEEERSLLDCLPFQSQCPEEEVELVKFLYENKLKKYNKPGDINLPSSLACLNDNLDMVVNLSERHYYNCDFRECFSITSVVLCKDPYNSKCLPLHIAVLVELKKANALFYIAHKLVEFYPTKPVAWFAVGCYYLLIGKSEPARRYLSKATTLDRAYGPAWLAFGHSFAADNEHDQAMAAYFTASQIMKGCHLPVLYIGLEYGLTNNSKLAEKFFSQALSIAPEDPFVLHEMGVIAYQNNDLVEAEQYFMEALKKVQAISKQTMAEKWEPLLNNLGHVCRKRKKYEDALEYHKQAEMICPQNPSTYSAIGYVYSLMGDNMKAVDYFHRALGIRRDDAFSTTMLGHVIEALMMDMSPCEGGEEEVPKFDNPKFKLVATPIAMSVAEDTSPTATPPNDSLADTSLAIDEVEMDASD